MGSVQFLRYKRGYSLSDLTQLHQKAQTKSNFAQLVPHLFDGSVDVLVNYDLLGMLDIGAVHSESKPAFNAHTKERTILIDLAKCKQEHVTVQSSNFQLSKIHLFEIKHKGITYLFPYHVLHQYFLLVSSHITQWLYHPRSINELKDIYQFVPNFVDEHGKTHDVIKLHTSMSPKHAYFAAELHFNPKILTRYDRIYTHMLQYRDLYQSRLTTEKPVSEYFYPKFTFPTDGEYELDIQGYKIQYKNHDSAFMVTNITSCYSDIFVPPYTFVPGIPAPQNADDDEELDLHNFGPNQVDGKPDKILDTGKPPSSKLSTVKMPTQIRKRGYFKPSKVLKVIPKQTARGVTIKTKQVDLGATGHSVTTHEEAHGLKFHAGSGQSGEENNLDEKPKEHDEYKPIAKEGNSTRFDLMNDTVTEIASLLTSENIEHTFLTNYYELQNSRKRYNRTIYYPDGTPRRVMVLTLSFSKEYGSIYVFEVDVLSKETSGDVIVTIPEEVQTHKDYNVGSKTLKSPMSASTLILYDPLNKCTSSDVSFFLTRYANNNGAWKIGEYKKDKKKKFLLAPLRHKSDDALIRANLFINAFKGEYDLKATTESDPESLDDKAPDQNKNQEAA